ncbi:MAG: hypothetical protein ACOVOR_02950 [Rhabdochlamydiaceae bacterium]
MKSTYLHLVKHFQEIIKLQSNPLDKTFFTMNNQHHKVFIEAPPKVYKSSPIDPDPVSISFVDKKPLSIEIADKQQQIPQKPVSQEINPFEDIKNILKKYAPTFAVKDTILNDISAKKIAKAYESKTFMDQTAIIYFNAHPVELKFLKNLCKAINIYLKPTKIVNGLKINQENKWDYFLNSDTLTHFILPLDTPIKDLKIGVHYRQNPASNEHFIKNGRIVFLEPLSHYLKNPEAKRKLWEKLCLLFRNT